MKKKISIIDHTGVKVAMEKYTDSLARAFAHFKHHTFIFSNYEFQKNDLITYYNIFESKGSNPVKKMVLRLNGYFKAARFSKKHQVDFIFIHLFELSIVSFLQQLITYYISRKKIVTIYHDISAFGKKDIKFLSRLILEKFTYKVIVHNEFSKKHLLQSFPFVNSDDVIIMKHGHYNSFVKTSDSRNTVNDIVDIEKLKMEGKKILLFFGQIKAEKGLDILLTALKHLPENIMLIIAGRPVTDFDVYNDYINANQMSGRVITYLRYIKDDEMDYMIQHSDLVVLPYKQIFQSGVLLNVLSQQALVLASDLEPNMDVIKNEHNGFLFKSESYESLAKQVALILNIDIEHLTAIKQNGFKTVSEEYDWIPIVDELLTKL